MIAAARLLVALLLCGGLAFAAGPLSPRQQAEDFESMWRAVDAGYAYFDSGRGAWKRVRATWKPRAARATTRADFVSALEGALEQLRDDHVSLSERSTRRRVPYESDVWARWKEGRAVVESVRTYSDADVAGLRPGHIVVRVDGVPIERAVRQRLGPTPPDAAALDWGLRQVLAGPRTGVQLLDVREPTTGVRAGSDPGQSGVRAGSDPGVTVSIERSTVTRGNAPTVVARRVGGERDVGYLRPRIGSGDARLVEQFEGAFNYLKDTRALIVDLRETMGPGGHAEAEAILARLGGNGYRAPIIVLVDRWTAGEGEALAAGLKAVGARIVGTAMAGLRGELREVTLPHSGIVVSFPAKKALLANGAPRESLAPDVAVDLAAPLGGPGDPILYQALKLVEPPCPGPACRTAPGSPPPARGSLRR